MPGVGGSGSVMDGVTGGAGVRNRRGFWWRGEQRTKGREDPTPIIIISKTVLDDGTVSIMHHKLQYNVPRRPSTSDILCFTVTVCICTVQTLTVQCIKKRMAVCHYLGNFEIQHIPIGRDIRPS